MIGTSFGVTELTDGAKELYMESGITKLQEFYGLSFGDLFEEEKLKEKGVSKKDMKYILDNREIEFARKEKEAWEMKANLFKTAEWLRIKDFYGITEKDIRDIDNMKKKGLKQKDINFIIGKKDEPAEKQSEANGDSKVSATVASTGGDSEGGDKTTGGRNIGGKKAGA